MTDSESLLLSKRLGELWRKSEKGYFTFTDFLGLGEQTVFARLLSDNPGIRYAAFGGAEGTERKIFRFGDEEELGYSEPFPIATVRCRPKSQKYAERLTHRDFLGAILNLGIERSLIGDIVIRENESFIFVKEEMADYVARSLERIRHTDVIAEISDTLPEGELFKTERVRIQASGERIDAVVAKVYHLSRDDSQSLIAKGLVFVNGALCEKDSRAPKEGDVISVRGHGRFIYRGYETLSKKGKMNIEVDLYV